MDVRQSIHSTHAEALDTQGLRNKLLVEKVLVVDEYTMIYNHTDRIIVDGIMPTTKMAPVGGEVDKQLDVSYFLERRELGITNIGGAGTITVDGQYYEIGHRGALYVGRGTKKVVLASIDTSTPMKFHYNCAPTHTTYPTKKVTPDEVSPVTLGDNLISNRRAINKYFVSDVLKICQLSMELTELAPDNLWNTMPCRTHERRMGVYFYFDMDDNTCVLHTVGQPQEARHIVMHNEQAVISPSWLTHSGVGTEAYTSIWGMAGESQVFDDMDHIAIKDLRQLQVQANRVLL